MPTENAAAGPEDSTVASAPDRMTGAGRPRQISIVAVLSLLMAAMIIPALIFAVVLLQRNNHAQQEMLTTLAEATTSSILETVDRQLTGMLTTLRVLSTSQALEDGAMADFYYRAAVRR